MDRIGNFFDFSSELIRHSVHICNERLHSGVVCKRDHLDFDFEIRILHSIEVDHVLSTDFQLVYLAIEILKVTYDLVSSCEHCHQESPNACVILQYINGLFKRSFTDWIFFGLCSGLLRYGIEYSFEHVNHRDNDVVQVRNLVYRCEVVAISDFLEAELIVGVVQIRVFYIVRILEDSLVQLVIDLLVLLSNDFMLILFLVQQIVFLHTILFSFYVRN